MNIVFLKNLIFDILKDKYRHETLVLDTTESSAPTKQSSGCEIWHLNDDHTLSTCFHVTRLG